MVSGWTIRRHVDWNGRRCVGYVNLGVVDEDNSSFLVAKETLDMMTVSMTGHWKVLVAHFLIDGLQRKKRSNLSKFACKIYIMQELQLGHSYLKKKETN